MYDVSRHAAVELTVNHCHFLNGNRTCGVKSRRVTSWLKLLGKAGFVSSLLRNRLAYSAPAEKYSGVPGISRSFLLNATFGQLPDVVDAVALEK